MEPSSITSKDNVFTYRNVSNATFVHKDVDS